MKTIEEVYLRNYGYYLSLVIKGGVKYDDAEDFLLECFSVCLKNYNPNYPAEYYVYRTLLKSLTGFYTSTKSKYKKRPRLKTIPLHYFVENQNDHKNTNETFLRETSLKYFKISIDPPCFKEDLANKINEKLTDKEREVFTKLIDLEYEPIEIATELEQKPSAVHSKIRNIKKKARIVIEQYYCELK